MANQFGAVLKLVRGGYDGLLDIHRQHGPVCAIGRYTLLLGPEANRFLFANPQLFEWGKAFQVLKPVTGETSLIVSDGADHKRRRGLVQPAFHHKQVNGYLTIMAEEADRLIDGWAGQVDLAREFQLVFRRMSVRSLFGERIGAQADVFGEQLETMIHLVERTPAVLNVHRLLRTRTWRHAMAGKQATDQQILAEIRRLRDGEASEDDRVLATLTRGRDEDGGGLSDIEIRDQVIGLIAAAFAATSAAMTWIVHSLLTNPGTWDRARDEVSRVLGDRAPAVADLPQLTYVHGVVQETLRLRPPGPVSVRMPVEGFTFDGKRIKAGRLVFYSPYVTHRLPELWPEPARFAPERWDPANELYRKPGPHEFLPFGGGPHRCVGSTLATTELTVMLTRLLARVCLELDPTPVVPWGITTMRPKHGLKARVGRAGHLRHATRPTSPQPPQ